jgi:aminoglycoside phosphotransferase family enzyme/predicted kinase
MTMSATEGPGAASVELTLAQQQRMVDALAASLARRGDAPRCVETHISHVLLHGGHAYKIKKALATSFLDQSTLARRRAACAEELRLNRRLAAHLYLDIVPITGTIDAPVQGGEGPLLDVAVRMLAFDESGLWDRLAAAGTLHAGDIDELAARLARFHADAAAAAPDGRFGRPEQARAALGSSLRDLLAALPEADTDDRALASRLQAWESDIGPRLAPVMARRLAAGRVREGHGDLHLGNVARTQAGCLVFDCIEFADDFRWLDVISEVAFLAMDLHAHGLPALAHRFVDAYLQHAGDYDGVRVLDYYLVHRALVRAKVALIRAGQTTGAARQQARACAHRYLALAGRMAQPRPRALLITHGLSGSGKTTLTQGLLEAAGAVRIRADVERKRLAGLGPLERSGATPGSALYGPAMTEATYARLLDAATAVLDGGWTAIADATFLRRADRQAAADRAAALGVPFWVLHFEAPARTLQERLLQRTAAGRDASDADAAVLALQRQAQEPLADDERPRVHVVEPLPGSGDAPPQADWSTLLQRLGATPSHPGPGSGRPIPPHPHGS